MPQDLTTGRFLPDPLGARVPTPCGNCGKIFQARRTVLRTGRGKYCSPECRNLGRRQRIQVACGTCSKIFQTWPCMTANGGGKFCSHPCYAASKPAKRVPATTRLWRYVQKTDDCWLWTRHVDSHGYGYMSDFSTGRPSVAVYRIAWEDATGQPVPDGMGVLHTCDTPACVRNDEEGTYEVRGVLLPRRGHLFLGTQQDNVADMWAKGRANPGGMKSRSIQ
jgi:hypothetical protein